MRPRIRRPWFGNVQTLLAALKLRMASRREHAFTESTAGFIKYLQARRTDLLSRAPSAALPVGLALARFKIRYVEVASRLPRLAGASHPVLGLHPTCSLLFYPACTLQLPFFPVTINSLLVCNAFSLQQTPPIASMPLQFHGHGPGGTR